MSPTDNSRTRASAFEKRGAEVVMHDLYQLTWPRVLLVCGLTVTLLLAAAAYVSHPILGIGAVLFFLFAMLMATVPSPLRDVVDLTVLPDAIELLDRRGVRDHVRRAEIGDGFLRESDGVTWAQFRVRRSGFLHVRVSDRTEGEALLDALGLTAPKRTASFAEQRQVFGFAALGAVPGFVVGLWLLGSIARWLPGNDDQLGTRLFALFVSLAVIPGACTGLAAIMIRAVIGPGARLVVGRDGVTIASGRKAPWFLPYESIASVSHDGGQVVLELHDAQKVRLRLEPSLHQAAAHAPGSAVDAAECVERRMVHAKNAGEETSELAMLAAAGRTPAEWLQSLRSVGADEHEGFREPPLSRDQLWRVVESPSAAVQRIAAAIALSSTANQADLARLTNIQKSTADAAFATRLRVAVEERENAKLEKILEEEAALEQSYATSTKKNG